MKQIITAKASIQRVRGVCVGDQLATLLERLAAQARGQTDINVGMHAVLLGGNNIRVSISEKGEAVPKKAKKAKKNSDGAKD